MTADTVTTPATRRRDTRAPHPVRDLLGSRLLWGVATIVLVAIIVYAATTVLPGDAANAILGRNATPDRVAALRHTLGLDRPLLTRFGSWISHGIRGDFGRSLDTHERVTSLMSERIANSAVLMIFGAVVATAVGVSAGTYAALRRDGIADSIGSIVSLVFNALPEFVVAIFVVMLFSVNVFHLYPGVSLLPPGTFILSEPAKLALPVVSLVIVTAPYIFRMTRAAMIEALASDYVETARLRGAGDRRVAFRHALPNALAPIVQVVGLTLQYLAGGIILVETVFSFPGLGSELVLAVTSRNVPVIQYAVLVLAIFYVAVNILTDVIVLLVTPRKRFPR